MTVYDKPMTRPTESGIYAYTDEAGETMAVWIKQADLIMAPTGVWVYMCGEPCQYVPDNVSCPYGARAVTSDDIGKIVHVAQNVTGPYAAARLVFIKENDVRYNRPYFCEPAENEYDEGIGQPSIEGFAFARYPYTAEEAAELGTAPEIAPETEDQVNNDPITEIEVDKSKIPAWLDITASRPFVEVIKPTGRRLQLYFYGVTPKADGTPMYSCGTTALNTRLFDEVLEPTEMATATDEELDKRCDREYNSEEFTCACDMCERMKELESQGFQGALGRAIVRSF